MKATKTYKPTAVPIDVTMTPFISFSSRISFAIVKTYVNLRDRKGVRFDDR